MIKNYIYLMKLIIGGKISKILLPKKIKLYRATIKFTENCNSRCITCGYWKNKYDDLISTQKAVSIIRELSEIGIKDICFSGGEPFLRKDFFEILNKMGNVRFRDIRVMTNGLLLDEYYTEINASPITSLAVSIDGLEETNDFIRGVKGYFKKVFNGLEKIKGKNIDICTVLSKQVAYELKDLINYCRDKGYVSDFALPDKNPFYFKNTQVDKTWPDEKAVDMIVSILESMTQMPRYEIEYIRNYLNKKTISEPPCLLGFTIIYIVSNGDVYTGCWALPPIGNILKNDLIKIINSDEYLKRIQDMVERKCPGCTCGYRFNLRLDNIVRDKRIISKALRKITS